MFLKLDDVTILFNNHVVQDGIIFKKCYVNELSLKMSISISMRIFSYSEFMKYFFIKTELSVKKTLYFDTTVHKPNRMGKYEML